MNAESPKVNQVERLAPALSAVPRREPPSAEVTRHLLEYLLSGDVGAGQKIPPERQLAQILNVGRSAVREAIKSLNLLGLLDVRQGDGTYLTGSTSDLLPQVIEWGLLLGEWRVRDLMEARTHLEVTVAGLAAELRTDEHIAKLREALGAMERADGDLTEYVEADLSLHLTIAEASGNHVLSGLLGSIRSQLRVWATRVLEAAGETETSLAVHIPIVDAIERRDADAARAAMAAHMARATKRLHAVPGGPASLSRPTALISVAPLLVATGITKRFGGVTAVSGVDIALMPGSIHAVVGENGAGKSTLMKIVDGVIAPDEGTITVLGNEVSFRSTHAAAEAGIGMVPQEIELFGELTVAENLFVGRDRPRTRWLGFDWAHMRRRAQELIESLGATLDVTVPVKQLSVANQQLVEIARALLRDARILIMDEPTASLSDRETSQLFAIIRALTKRGVGILYISHRLDEVFTIADHITVMRDGHKVASGRRSDFTHDSLINHMIGRPLSTLYTRHRGTGGAPALQVRGLTRHGEYSDISFELRKGEIVGLAGLIGAGRTEVAQTIYGLRSAHEGEIRLGDKPVEIDSPQTALSLGVAYVPEERRSQGTIGNFSVARNITFSSLDRLPGKFFLDRRAEGAFADRFVEALDIKCASPSVLIDRLSGGNQQKVVVARSLAREPEVLMLDEPTRGVDVGAKAELYRLIDELGKSGKAILLISSEIPELLAMSDRILVMHEGALVAEFEGDSATQELVGAAAAGVVKNREAIPT